jgi:low temperature requirement protein LtrA
VQISHLPERFGLFTIIVLGETILAVTAAVSSVTWTLLAVFIAVAGFAIAVCLWWVYFDYVDVGVVQRALTGGRVELWRSFVFGYGHLFIFAGIIAAGVGLEFAIEEATHAALSPGVLAALCGGIAAVLFAASATQWLTRRSLHSNIPYVRSGASALIVILGMIGGSLAPALVLGLLLLILAALAAYELSLDRQLRLGAAKPQTQT